MLRLRDEIGKVSPSDGSILLVGESGTGKTRLAKQIHDLSGRRQKPFVVVHCSRLAESLLDAEFFGHVKGAFTGAIRDRVGQIEKANGGTLFFDEISDLSLSGQVKLLSALQEKSIERLGSSHSLRIDVRVISATQKDLSELARAGKFREDLYHRLNLFECHLLPVRERLEDLDELIRECLLESSQVLKLGKITKIPEKVLARLRTYSWPGNLVELQNVIHRLVFLSEGREARYDDLPDGIQNLRKAEASKPDYLKSLADVEREQIDRVLSREHNQERAADILGITTVTLWRKRKELGLP